MSPEQQILQLGMSYYPSRTLVTAIQLGFFSKLGTRKMTAEALAREAGTHPRGTAMLLDALVGIELLKKEGGQYANTPVSDRFLKKDSPEYMGAMFEDDQLWEMWGKLPEVVRTNKPPVRVETQQKAEEFFPILIRSLHVMNREPARATAKALGAGHALKGAHVLDVACGSGVWSIAFAEADRAARLTAHDFPKVLDHTRSYLQRHEVLDRYDFLPGDLKSVDFGKAKYDVALLGNIVHSEGEKSSRELFRRMHAALKPGGKLAIIDMIPNDERTGPPFPLFFALNMLVNTADGSTYTLAEYRSWLLDAGFARVETADIGSHSPLVIGVKA
jgi:ubiquinone/menaquinone biosynthesis C-methylase UbiE